MWECRDCGRSVEAMGICECRGVEARFNFPKTKFVDENSLFDQLKHMESEAKEFILELRNPNGGELADILDEATDFVHAWETLARMEPMYISNSISRVAAKNRDRGYYADQSTEEPAQPPVTAAHSFLVRAAELLGDRGKEYDSPGGERSMGRAVEAFNAITGRELTEAEGWLLLQVLKDVRQWQRPDFHRDSAEDCISYAGLKAEALARTVVVHGAAPVGKGE